MAVAFQPTLRFYRLFAWWGLALPVVAGIVPRLHLRFGLAASCAEGAVSGRDASIAE
jgi:hypothetical protein